MERKIVFFLYLLYFCNESILLYVLVSEMRRLLSLFFSFLILLSSMGFTLGTHYCGGYAMKSGFIFSHNSLDCGMNEAVSECEIHPSSTTTKTVIKNNNCCTNDLDRISTDNMISLQSLQKEISKPFIALFIAVFTKHSVSVSKDISIAFHDFSPDIPDRDFQTLYQSFLI